VRAVACPRQHARASMRAAAVEHQRRRPGIIAS
jgi:hypothetical protein